LLSFVPRAAGLGILCLITIFGGALATYLCIKKSATPVRGGEGIIVGAMAGAVTGLLRLAYFPINYMINRENIEMELQRTEEELRRALGFNVNMYLMVLAGGIFAVILLVIIEAIGGAIGVALFETRKGGTDEPPPPPPPTDFAQLPGGDPGV
jgi:hypothetical protein